MNFKDQWAVDSEGNQFLFTVEMQRKLSAAGLPIEPESLAEIPESSAPARSNNKPAPAQQSAVVEPEIIQIDPMTGKYIGRLKWYDASRGYGFIARGAGEDIFFHKTSSISDPRELSEGQAVLYDVEERKKGPEATEVEPYTGDLV